MTIPFIMVTALAVYGWVVLDDIEAKKPDTLVVNVTGQQFAWSFDYPAEKVKSNRLVLPKDRPVEFRIKTQGRAARLLGARVPAEVRRRARHHHEDPAHPVAPRRVRRGLRGAVRHRPLDHAPGRCGS